jgi:predicted DNA-binding transcriptional regulator YafY
MKINRLLEISLVLLNKGTVTAKELAERFGVSTRTIYRDVDILSTAGIPVYTNKGNGGGISILDNFSINKTVLNEGERDSLLLALKTLQSTKYPEIDKVLDKIGAVFKQSPAADWVDINFSPWGSGPNAENKLLNIKMAILGCHVITFDYINANGIKSQRTAEPLQLRYNGQAWYMSAYCRTRQQVRTFRLSRIKNLVVTDKAFTRRPVENAVEEEPEPVPQRDVTLKLRFRPEHLYRVFDDYDEEKITRNPDGSYDVMVTFPEDEWVYGYILSFGNYVEVLEPQHIRNIITDRMRKTLAIYESSF